MEAANVKEIRKKKLRQLKKIEKYIYHP